MIGHRPCITGPSAPAKNWWARAIGLSRCPGRRRRRRPIASRAPRPGDVDVGPSHRRRTSTPGRRRPIASRAGRGRPAEPSSRPTRRRRSRPVGQPAPEGNDSGGQHRRPACRRRRRPIASSAGADRRAGETSAHRIDHETLSHRSFPRAQAHGVAADTQSRHPFPIAPNVLARQFERTGPDQAWVTDITYIPTGEGWLYLAVILDLCSRFAVGWAMNERITDDLTLDALGMALARRRPPQGLLHHSDRGSQYASGDYQRVLAQHGIVCSMSRRGDCWDNAVAESFFATLKVELVHDATWATRTAARTELFDYLEVFYNGQRRHSALGYLSPRAFERRREQEAVAT